MKKGLLLMVVFLAVNCRTTKMPINDQTYVVVKSAIPERHRRETIVFRQKGDDKFVIYSNGVKFKDPKLRHAYFGFEISGTDGFASDNEVGMYDNAIRIDSIVTPEYSAKVWKVSSAHPAYKEYEHEFKVISVWIKQKDYFVNCRNTSDFKDSITPQFIAQKLNALEFTLKPKS